jgi:hypothetical protein
MAGTFLIKSLWSRLKAFLCSGPAVENRLATNFFFVRHPNCPAGLWISMSGCPLRDGSGPVYGGVVFFQDVTQRRQEVQAITLLSRVVEQTADSVMAYRQAGHD